MDKLSVKVANIMFTYSLCTQGVHEITAVLCELVFTLLQLDSVNIWCVLMQ